MLGLKGVSKSVVELSISDHAYFERAVFYLKPNLQGIPARALHQEAQQWVQTILPAKQYTAKSIVRHLLWMMSCGALGACIAAAVILLRG